MSVKAIEEEIKKGLKGPSYLLYANDPFLLKEALSTIKAALPQGMDGDFNFNAYDLESPDPTPPIDQLIDVLNTLPFMGGRKTVVIENCHKLNAAGAKAIGAYLGNQSPESLLLMTYHLKYERFAEKKSKEEKIKSTYKGARIMELNVREAEFPIWVAQRARARGISIERAEAAILIELVGHHLGLLASEIDKLSLLGKPAIGRDDILAMVRGSGDYGMFEDLVPALDRKDLPMATRICKKLVETNDPIMMLGALNFHFAKQSTTARKKRKIYRILNEADKLIRSSGGAYPMELLIFKLLSV